MKFKKPQDARRFVMLQLVDTMLQAKTAEDTQRIAEAMFRARMLWDSVIAESEREASDSESSANPASREDG